MNKYDIPYDIRENQNKIKEIEESIRLLEDKIDKISKLLKISWKENIDES